MSEQGTYRATEGAGADIPRKEDFRFLTGRGRYTADVDLPGQLYAAMVRTPHAHARIRAIDTGAASRVPGVVTVLTGHDVAQDGLRNIRHTSVPVGMLDRPLVKRDAPLESEHPLLAVDKVRFVGEIVAMVVANTLDCAKDAAELVEIDYDVLPAVCRTPDAVRSPILVWEDMGVNVYSQFQAGDEQATHVAFDKAAHVVGLESWVQRVMSISLETRGAIGRYDMETGKHELIAGSGGVSRFRDELAAVFDLPLEQVRAVTYDVGGNFGPRNAFYPEYALVVWAAKRVGQPVKWIAERSEGLLSDCHGRDLAVQAAIALDADAKLLGMRCVNTSNIGAHPYSLVSLQTGLSLVTSLYHVPAAHVTAIGVATNTSSTTSYRSAGRPEVIFVMERLMDLAAIRLDIDRVEIRRRNLVKPQQLPYRNPFGKLYDSGRYEEAMDAVLELADWRGFPARREEARRRNRLRGIAIANYIETTGGAPREWTHVTVRPDGRIDVAIGTQSSGQSHETSFAQLLHDWLGVPVSEVSILEGDTDRLTFGGGTQSGRSMRFASVILYKASQEIRRKACAIVSHILEVAPSDLEFQRGRFAVKGTDRSMSLYDAAHAAEGRVDLPEGLKGPLSAAVDEAVEIGSSPYGAHVCEIEIDPESGAYELVRYSAVDDVGRAVSPKILHGQIHGGIVQGLGQALLEHAYYDPDSGQLLAGSLMDYAIPRAADLPAFATVISEVPSTTHPLGLRSGSESGTPPALPAAVGAIVDALSHYGVTHLDMPVTAECIWRAIHASPPARPTGT